MEVFDLVRSDFFITKKKIYLNNGSISPLPISTVKSITDFCLRYSEQGPDSIEFNNYLDDLKIETRKRVANLINCHQDEIIFTQSTTEGINLIGNGLNWKDGDSLLIRNPANEHFSNYLPWIKLSSEKNLKVKKFPQKRIESSGTALLEEFKEVYTSDYYKMVSTSHIMYNNGSITPVEKLGDIIKKRNRNTLFSVDGAQSVGTMTTDVKKIKCDFLTFPSFKWLCGPLGLGILYVNKQVMDNFEHVFVGSGTGEAKVIIKPNSTESNYRNNDETFIFYKYPDKYHPTFRNFPGLAGLEASLRYLLRIGISNIFQRNKHLSTLLRDQLIKIQDVLIHEAEEEEFRSSLISFSFKRRNNEKIQKLNIKLQEQGVILAEREIGSRKIMRASPHFFNSEDDMIRAAEAIKSILNGLD